MLKFSYRRACRIRITLQVPEIRLIDWVHSLWQPILPHFEGESSSLLRYDSLFLAKGHAPLQPSEEVGLSWFKITGSAVMELFAEWARVIWDTQTCESESECEIAAIRHEHRVLIQPLEIKIWDRNFPEAQNQGSGCATRYSLREQWNSRPGLQAVTKWLLEFVAMIHTVSGGWCPK